MRDVVDWYAITFKDKLMTYPFQPWFTALVGIEVLFQVPFFFLAIYALLHQSKNCENSNALIRGDSLFRSLCIVYGSSTATTLIPIFASIFTNQDTTVGEKAILCSFYLPYIIFPLWLVVIAVCEDNVFGTKMAKKSE